MLQIEFFQKNKLALVDSKKIEKIHHNIVNKEGKGKEFLDWVDWPEKLSKKEIDDLLLTSKKIQSQAKVLLVIGIGGSYLGARAGLEMIRGLFPKNDKMEVIFLGHTMSSTYIKQVFDYVQNKEFVINVISKSGTTLEPALSFRIFKDLLIKRKGKKFNEYIYATTDAKRGALKTYCTKEKIKTFIIPDGIGGRYSVLTPVGLLPFAVAGINIKQILEGAKLANKDTMKPNNTAYQYANIRYSLYKKGFTNEVLSFYDIQMSYMGEWWKQLFGESEGKDNKGLFPVSCLFTTDLHSLGQFIQSGKKTFFQTSIVFEKSLQDIKITKDSTNLDGLNYLSGKNMSYINDIASKGVVKAHSSENDNILIKMPEISAKTFGYLVQWFFKACACSAYLLDVNPFDQPGVEVYKKEVFELLKK